MTRTYSNDFLKDPARVLRLMGEYEKQLIPLFKDFAERMAEADLGTDLEAVSAHIDALLEEAVLSPAGSIIQKAVPLAYRHGDRFAGTMIQKAGQRAHAATEWWETVALLVTKNVGDLKGITDEVAKRIRRTIADGLLAGKSQGQMAREIAGIVEDVGEYRARLMVKTETMRAVNAGTKDRYERGGFTLFERIEVDDDRTCDYCLSIDGKICTREEADAIDASIHPGCRGTWLPYVKKEAP